MKKYVLALAAMGLLATGCNQKGEKSPCPLLHI